MNDLFDVDTTQASADFIVLRDESRNAKLKTLAQEMWQSFSDWADPHFPAQFAINVHQRFWEMYLGVRLIERGFRLIPRTSQFGPDFHLLLNGENLWIEATAPEVGSGNDAVPSIFEHDKFQPVPEDKIILRFTSAIAEKTRKRDEYIKKGIVAPEDRFVIALNGAGINMTIFEGPFPAFVLFIQQATIQLP